MVASVRMSGTKNAGTSWLCVFECSLSSVASLPFSHSYVRRHDDARVDDNESC